MASIYAWPNHAGVRFRGANIIPRPTDSGNGDASFPANFYDILYDWGTSDASDPWTRWIKPQIDAASAQGCNLIRLMLDATVRVGDVSHHGVATWRGTITAPQLATMNDQIIAYCATLGMYYYPAVTEVAPVQDSGISLGSLQSFITEVVAKVSDTTYHNVVGIDVLQEFSRSAFCTTNLAACMATAVAALVKTLPLTSSIYIVALSGAHGPDPASNSDFGSLNTAGNYDFFDVHIYTKDMTRALADLFIGNSYSKPVISCETGCSQSGYPGTAGAPQESSHPYSSEQIAEYYDQIAWLGSMRELQAVAVWSIAPNYTISRDNDYGFYAETQNGSYVLTTPRTARTSRLTKIGKTIAARNTAWMPDLSGANNGLNYSVPQRFNIGSMMRSEGSGPFGSQGAYQLNTNAIQIIGATSASSYTVPNNIQAFLLCDALPSSLQQTVVLEIPASAANVTGGPGVDQYIQWQAVVRFVDDSNYYLVELSSDNTGAFDNTVQVYKVIAGTATSLGFSTFAPGNPLTLSKRWRLTVDVSAAISPTTITATVRNVTDAVSMTPLVVNDSTAALQVAGGVGLHAHYGYAFTDNVSFKTYPDPGPVMSAAPASTPASTTVALTWAAADGGTGTITYTPQYATKDANGFPSSTWTDGSGTTGTSGTVSSLVASTNYLFRIKTVDSAGSPVTAYSPWLAAATTAGGGMPLVMHHRKMQGAA